MLPWAIRFVNVGLSNSTNFTWGCDFTNLNVGRETLSQVRIHQCGVVHHCGVSTVYQRGAVLIEFYQFNIWNKDYVVVHTRNIIHKTISLCLDIHSLSDMDQH